jgi:hypothetical protein
VVALVVAAVVAFGAVCVASVFGYLGGGRTVEPNGNFSVAEARSFRGFPVFYLGESVDGYPLSAVAHLLLLGTVAGAIGLLWVYLDAIGTEWDFCSGGECIAGWLVGSGVVGAGVVAALAGLGLMRRG